MTSAAVVGDARAVVFGVAHDVGLLVISEGAAHFRGNAGYERTGGNLLPLEHEGPGGYQRTGAHDSAVHHDGAHSDQAVILDGAAVDHGVVPHRHVSAHEQGTARVAVS